MNTNFKLIVGLGNPDSKYQKNRHNVGFMFIDYLVGQLDKKVDDFSYQKKFESKILKIDKNKHQYLLVKPQTYMNDSGRSVYKIVNYYNINVCKNLYLVHDDLDIKFGKVKLINKGPKVHNGVNSVIRQLKTDRFNYFRIGINGDQYRIIKNSGKNIADHYVLQNFNKEELNFLPNIFENIILTSKII